jgi:hypothetical protein
VNSVSGVPIYVTHTHTLTLLHGGLQLDALTGCNTRTRVHKPVLSTNRWPSQAALLAAVMVVCAAATCSCHIGARRVCLAPKHFHTIHNKPTHHAGARSISPAHPTLHAAPRPTTRSTHRPPSQPDASVLTARTTSIHMTHADTATGLHVEMPAGQGCCSAMLLRTSPSRRSHAKLPWQRFRDWVHGTLIIISDAEARTSGAALRRTVPARWSRGSCCHWRLGQPVQQAAAHCACLNRRLAPAAGAHSRPCEFATVKSRSRCTPHSVALQLAQRC